MPRKLTLMPVLQTHHLHQPNQLQLLHHQLKTLQRFRIDNDHRAEKKRKMYDIKNKRREPLFMALWMVKKQQASNECWAELREGAKCRPIQREGEHTGQDGDRLGQQRDGGER